MLWKIVLALLGIVVLTLVVMVFKLAKMDAKDEVSNIEKLSKNDRIIVSVSSSWLYPA